MKIFTFKDYDDVSIAASKIVIKEMIKNKDLTLGLATGSTPLGLYQNLVNAYKENIITFKDVLTFNLDEYVGLDQSNPQSYSYYMYKHLFDHVDINTENIYIPSGDKKNIQTNISEYNKLLNDNQRDLQILGIGANAHIGFNEPGSKIGNQSYIIELDEDTRNANSRFFNTLEEVPTHAITMGIKNIMFSREIILIATGIEKANAVYNMVQGEVTNDVPASILQLHPNVTVLLDEAAASRLTLNQ